MLKQYIDYIKDNPKGYWFKAKWFGWGWTPVTWQGWLIIIFYVILFLYFTKNMDNRSTDEEVLVSFALPILLSTLGLVFIAFKKGEKPKWHWGIPKKKLK